MGHKLLCVIAVLLTLALGAALNGHSMIAPQWRFALLGVLCGMFWGAFLVSYIHYRSSPFLSRVALESMEP